MVPRRSVRRRAATSVLPPPLPSSVLPDEAEMPVIIRTSIIHQRRTSNVNKQQAERQRLEGKKPSDPWLPLAVCLPRDVCEVAGLELGMTVVIEAYRNQMVRVFAAGDSVSRDEELI